MTDRRTRRIVAEDANPIVTEQGEEQPWAEVVDDLTWGEIKKLPPIAGTLIDAAAAACAMYVIRWNLLGRDAETGELVPLPSPAEGGPEVFDAVEPWVIGWVFTDIGTGHMGGAALRKKPSPLSDSPGGPPAKSEE